LSTCKLINVELAPILAPKLSTLHAEPRRFIIETAAIDSMFYDSTFSAAVLHHLPQDPAAPVPPIDEAYIMALCKPGVVKQNRDDYTPFFDFIHACATYIHVRRPKSTIMAVLRDTTLDFSDVALLLHLRIWQDNWSALPIPIGFMFRATEMDDEQDPPNAAFPGGERRALLKEAVTVGRGLDSCWVEDVGEEQWIQVWRETE
jgi:hypothetical protein